MRRNAVTVLFFICALYLAAPAAMTRAYAQTDKPAAGEKAVEDVRDATADTPGKKDAADNAGQTPVTGDPVETSERTNLFATVRQGGFIMIPIIFLGLLAMTIVIERLIFFSRNRVWKPEQLDELLTRAKTQSKAKFREDMEDDLRNAFQVYANRLERGLGMLSGVGNLAPILGFLGTVVGMISAFAAIAAATTVNAKVVAAGIQEALITTAGGLMVAAPTLFFYYIFTNAIQNYYARSEEYIGSITEDLPRLSDKIKNGG